MREGARASELASGQEPPQVGTVLRDAEDDVRIWRQSIPRMLHDGVEIRLERQVPAQLVHIVRDLHDRSELLRDVRHPDESRELVSAVGVEGVPVERVPLDGDARDVEVGRALGWLTGAGRAGGALWAVAFDRFAT